MSFKEMS
ncbi:Protein of unknown function [Propionibacterium freudenreichii]|nr:Protein of unknown function [Propionibacterium freudenreichii]